MKSEGMLASRFCMPTQAWDMAPKAVGRAPHDAFRWINRISPNNVDRVMRSMTYYPLSTTSLTPLPRSARCLYNRVFR